MKVHTGQIAKWQDLQLTFPNYTFVDTTIKSGDAAFAPTWEMVTGVKSGTLSKEQYRAMYLARMRESQKTNPTTWLALFDHDNVVLGCYCRHGTFCHRYILVELLETFAEQYGLDLIIGDELIPDIYRFKGYWSFLSNFFESPFEYKGETWTTLEHAFQALKMVKREDYEKVRDADKPGQAKRYGRKGQRREDWDEVKDGIMLDLVRAKFNSSEALQRLLLETGERRLYEGNQHGDDYWGVVDGVGRNQLGITLEQVRNELKQNQLLLKF